MPAKKSVLITGCSSGFGRQMVTEFLKNDWHVYATMRRSESRRMIFREELSAHQENLEILEFDVTKDIDRETIAKKLEADGGKLSALVNNAGFGLFSALEDASSDLIRKQLEINVLGTILTTRRLLPYLRAAHGHIINFSSVLGYSTLPLNSLYCSSKYAIEGFSEALSHELHPHDVKVSIIEPGAFSTDFQENVNWGENSDSKESPYYQQTLNFREVKKRFTSKFVDPMIVTKKVVAIADCTNPPLRVRLGQDARMVHLAKSLTPAPVMNWTTKKIFSHTFNKKS